MTLYARAHRLRNAWALSYSACNARTVCGIRVLHPGALRQFLYAKENRMITDGCFYGLAAQKIYACAAESLGTRLSRRKDGSTTLPLVSPVYAHCDFTCIIVM